MKEKIERIANYYGIASQLRQTVEECNELSLACCKVLREEKMIENLLEEIADVEIMTAQLKFLIQDGDVYVEKFKRAKLDRQLRRIEEKEKQQEQWQEDFFRKFPNAKKIAEEGYIE